MKRITFGQDKGRDHSEKTRRRWEDNIRTS